MTRLPPSPRTPATRSSTGWRGWPAPWNRAARVRSASFWKRARLPPPSLVSSPAPRRRGACWSWPPRAGLSTPRSPLRLNLPPLSADDVATLIAAGLGHEAPAESAAAILSASGGNAAVASALTRRLIANVRCGSMAALSLRPGQDLDALLAEGFAALAPAARQLLLAVALVAGAGHEDVLRVAGLDEDGAAVAAADARRAGWLLTAADGALLLPSAAHRRVVLGQGEQWAGAIAARALAAGTLGAEHAADALLVAGRPGDAAGALREAAGRAVGDPARVAGLLARALALAPLSLSFRERIVQATGLGALGRYEDAGEALSAARLLVTTAAESVEIAEREAWLCARRGDLQGARATLERALDGAAPAATRTLRARLARMLVTGGRYAEALAALAPLGPLVEEADPAGVLAAEAALLANAYRGDLAAASRQLAVVGPALGDTRRVYLSGLLAQLAGDAPSARDFYRAAYAQAAAADDIHTLASVALNLGGLLIDEGLYGEALTATARAVRELGRLDARAELLPALINSANLLVSIGDLSAARRSLDRAAALARGSGAPAALATAAFVEGDLARRAGEPESALARYTESRHGFAAASANEAAAAAAAARAEVLAALGRLVDARAALDDARVLRGSNTDDPNLARAEAVLALADSPSSRPAELADRLERLARSAAQKGRRPIAWRLAALAAAVAGRAGRSAGDMLDLARRTFEEVRMATPDHHRATLAQDPDTVWLSPGGAGAADGALAARAQAAEARLRRLLRINKRLNSELRLPRLLEMILDTVIELTDAERGFLLLEDDTGELQVKAARNIDQRTLETDELALSRSIARQAAAGGEPVVTIDAAGDDRFRQALSVSDLHLRSVLAVPLLIKGRAAGTIYVDHRLRKGAFDQDDVRLVLDFAEQAAIAIENARLLAELRRRERQIEALNRRLEAELAVRREEISGIKIELRENREALAVRYDYRNIVGRTPKMLELFRLIDRITDTTLPVVIQGESGTGKELVARALHANGPRRDRPFVGENCAAIPETLLESTLFGYVRGAFTGAEHDTRGLFEVADGGTLFLDEVGEMSPAMQGKLLRVLQEGELRRVGSERTRKVDVRIVAATNRDLGAHGGRGEVPSGPVLSVERGGDRAAAPARPPRRHPAHGRALPDEDRDAFRPAAEADRRGRHGTAAGLPVARERSRARERADPLRGVVRRTHHGGGPLATGWRSGRRRRAAGRGHGQRVAEAAGRTAGTSAHPGGARPGGEQPDQGCRAAGPVAVRPAEEAQEVQLCRIAPTNLVAGPANAVGARRGWARECRAPGSGAALALFETDDHDPLATLVETGNAARGCRGPLVMRGADPDGAAPRRRDVHARGHHGRQRDAKDRVDDRGRPAGAGFEG